MPAEPVSPPRQDGISSRVLLAIMPNGEAFRADRVTAVRIVADETLVREPVMRYAVDLHLDNEPPIRIALDLARSEAEQMAAEIARRVNGQLQKYL